MQDPAVGATGALVIDFFSQEPLGQTEALSNGRTVADQGDRKLNPGVTGYCPLQYSADVVCRVGVSAEAGGEWAGFQLAHEPAFKLNVETQIYVVEILVALEYDVYPRSFGEEWVPITLACRTNESSGGGFIDNRGRSAA